MAALKILYVDDDADIRDIAEMSLEMDPGFDVRLAASGPEALAILADWPADAVLLDVMMPQMDGPAMLATLRGQTERPQPKVVFITARTRVSDVAQLRALGAVGVIHKPFDPMSLAAEVRQALEG